MYIPLYLPISCSLPKYFPLRGKRWNLCEESYLSVRLTRLENRQFPSQLFEDGKGLFHKLVRTPSQKLNCTVILLDSNTELQEKKARAVHENVCKKNNQLARYTYRAQLSQSCIITMEIEGMPLLLTW